MSNCPICLTGTLIKSASRAGEETYCKDCRKIVKSATLGFVFTAAGEQGIEECKGPADDPRPGYKGPGTRAHCFLYDPGNDNAKKRAEQKARNSAYSTQHKRAASKIANRVHGIAYFEGIPNYVSTTDEIEDKQEPSNKKAASSSNMAVPSSASALPQVVPGQLLGMPTAATDAAAGVPAPGTTMPQAGNSIAPSTPAMMPKTTPAMMPKTTPAMMPKMTSKEDPFNHDTKSLIPGADEVQPGELNGANPLNSGTIASKRLAELTNQFSDNPVDVRAYMGPGFCTVHNKIDGCKLEENA
jgi:hypothetical protein